MTLLKFFNKLISKSNPNSSGSTLNSSFSTSKSESDGEIAAAAAFLSTSISSSYVVCNNNSRKAKKRSRKASPSSSSSSSSSFFGKRRSSRTTTTRHINKLVESYTRLAQLRNPIITINKNSFRTNNHFDHYMRLQPIAESSLLSSKSLCTSCTNSAPITVRYCKCCGKEVRTEKRVCFTTNGPEKPATQLIGNSNATYQLNRTRKMTKTNSNVQKACLKKSKAMVNIKQPDSKKFVVTSVVHSSTMLQVNTNHPPQPNNESLKRKSVKSHLVVVNQHQLNANLKVKLAKANTNESELRKIFPRFSVDFASTPIKLAPKTSTPIKLKNPNLNRLN